MINHTKVPVRKHEGCMTFPFTQSDAETWRFHKITVEFQTVLERENGELYLSPVQMRHLSGLESQIWQHEFDHFECKYIYTLI